MFHFLLVAFVAVQAVRDSAEARNARRRLYSHIHAPCCATPSWVELIQVPQPTPKPTAPTQKLPAPTQMPTQMPTPAFGPNSGWDVAFCPGTNGPQTGQWASCCKISEGVHD